MRRLIPACTAVLVLASCAPSIVPKTETAGAVGASGRQCFFPNAIRNFRATSDGAVYIRTSRSDVFEITSTACRDASSANAIALTSATGSTSLCVGDPAVLAVPDTGGIGPSPCRVRVTRKLTADQIAALPSRDRP